MKTESIYGEPSWSLRARTVELAVTQRGGHLAPVRFRLGKRTVEPFHIAPWAGERGLNRLPPLLQVLRGDFFCFPFGGNAQPWRGEKHPPHGETANGSWRFVRAERTDTDASLILRMRTRIRPAVVEKTLRLVDGHTAVYCRHVVKQASGLMNLGHHATLRFPASGGRISTSEIVGGQVYPGQFEDPAAGGYNSLKAGAEFRSLACVPLANGGWADLTRYPAREGFEDLVMVSARPGTDFAWTAVVFPGEGYVWYALKDPRVLASTVLWHSNGGRHYFPWNGRHRAVLGLEEVTAHFHDGLCESAQPNAVADRGIRTALRLQPRRPLAVNVIMCVAPIPEGFERVRRLDRTDGGILLHGENGHVVETAVDTEFLSGGAD